MSTFRYAILGAAKIATKFCQAASLVQNCQVCAVASKSLERAKVFAGKNGIPKAYGSYEELLDRERPDCAYIAVTANDHYRLAMMCVERGVPVLCEKAITLNSAELEEARALAAENGVQLMDATTILHMPLYRELRRRADAGEFGPLNLVQASFGSYKEYGDLTNRFYNPDLAGGAMLDIGVYALTFARLFMGSQPDELVSLGNLASTGVDEKGGIVARNAEQQLAVVSLSLHSKQPKRGVLSFDRCYIQVDEYPRADSARIVWTEDGSVEEVAAGEEAYALCYEMADLERAVAGDEDARALIGHAADVMDLMTSLRAAWGVVYPEERQA